MNLKEVKRREELVLRLLRSGWRGKDITRRCKIPDTITSRVKRKYGIIQENVVISPENEKWFYKNKPKELTASEFINSFLTDARLEEEDDQ